MCNKSYLNNTQKFDNATEAEPVIDIAGLRFGWKKDGPSVLQLDQFSVKKGELLFVMGASGSGKSTLLSIISGILHGQSGVVKVLGNDISQMKGSVRDRFRADNIGYIFQMFNLIPYLSVLENVVLPCRFSGVRKKRALLNATTLHDEARRLLDHLKLNDPQLLNKPVVELSVGQQQRVAAARALIGAPDLIIADEPTSSLDTEHREFFLRLLFNECVRVGSTLIFVSHDSSLATMFDRVVEMSQINAAHRALKEGGQ